MKECCKCGSEDYFLYEYDGNIYCEKCLIDKLHIERSVYYHNDDGRFDDFDKICDYYGIKEVSDE